MRWKKWESLKQVVRTELTQGVNKRQIALAVVGGVTLGVFPVLGTTTFLCGLFSHFLKLNHLIVQGVNYVVYPIQLLAWFPLILLGSSMTGVNLENWSSTTLKEEIMSDPLRTLASTAWTQIYGVVAWSIIVIPVAFILYALVMSLLQKKVGIYEYFNK